MLRGILIRSLRISITVGGDSVTCGLLRYDCRRFHHYRLILRGNLRGTRCYFHLETCKSVMKILGRSSVSEKRTVTASSMASTQKQSNVNIIGYDGWGLIVSSTRSSYSIASISVLTMNREKIEKLLFIDKNTLTISAWTNLNQLFSK